MVKQKHSPTINLAHKRTSYVDQFINWALTLGRLIIMVTFFVGLSAFAYRISLDWKIIDLREKITQQQKIINLLAEEEKKYRNLQDRLTTAALLSNKGTDTLSLLKVVIASTPPDIIFDNVSLGNDRLKIVARAHSIASLASFVGVLRKNPSIQTLSVDKIENKTASATIFVSVTAITKKK